MGLSTPATKVWEIPEPKPAYAPEPPAKQRELDVVALDDALNELSRMNPQQSGIVELRFFAGLSIEETAKSVGVSPATVKPDWAVARAWLYRELARSTPQ